MTIICYRDGVMAADGGAFWSDIRVARARRKIVRLPSGGLAAATGATIFIQKFEMYLRGYDTGVLQGGDNVHGVLGIKGETRDEFYGMIVRPDGSVIGIDHESDVVLLERDSAIFAMGAAADMAYGAMLAGASAEEAVRICVANHAYAAGEVQVERLDAGRVADDPEDLGDGGDVVTSLGFEADGRRNGYQRWREEHGLS